MVWEWEQRAGVVKARWASGEEAVSEKEYV
jgi:hypothetical protein